MLHTIKNTSKRALARAFAAALSCVLLIGGMPLIGHPMADDAPMGTVIVDSANVRNNPGTVNTTVIDVARNGTRVTVGDVVTISGDPSGSNVWCKISYTRSDGATITGYVVDSFISKDADINADPNFETEIASFPESYKTYLRALHKAHPNWHFKPVQTLKDFPATVASESRLGVSLIENSVNDAWKSTEPGAYDWNTGTFTPYDGSTWVNASQAVVKYYLDPRNMLTEDYVFQFLNLSYEPASQTIDSVKCMLKGTFMDNVTIKDWDNNLTTYADSFVAAAEQCWVNPVFLAAKVIQEVSANGSNSTSGSYYSSYYKRQYTDLYNFFNIGASSGQDPVAKGLAFAREGWKNADGSTNTAKNNEYYIPWVTPYFSIRGGSKFIANAYINIGQNTTYFMKFNVNPKDASQFGNHQYMTNIRGAASEGKKMYNAYAKAGILNTNLTFAIPVYSGLPESACLLPRESGNPNDYLKELSINGYVLTPAFDPATTEYSLVVPASCTAIHVDAKPASDKARVSGAGDIALGDGVSTIKINCTAENGSSKVYTLDVARNTDASSSYFTTTLAGEGNFFGGVEPGTTVGAVKAMFTLAQGYQMTYVNMNGQGKDDSSAVCSGDLIEITDANGKKVYIGALFIRGDANCDGKISSADLTMICRYILGTGNMTEAGKFAADGNKDGKISAADLTKICKHILQETTITQ
jgi:beta-N-acetylglucosaminidase